MTFVSFAVLAATVLGLGWYLTRSVMNFRSSRFDRGMKDLQFAGFVLGGYVALLFGLSLASPNKVIPAGQPRCFGDWCATVDQTFVRDGQVLVGLTVRNKGARPIRLSSPSIQVSDSRGRSARPGKESGPPLDAMLAPGESFTKDISFYMPLNSERMRIVIERGNWLTKIAPGHENSLFHGRPGTPVER